MEDFVRKKNALSSKHIPVASYNDDEAKNSNEKMLTVIEGFFTQSSL
jgi:hypothetical protein